jgi:hypothetical protein
LEKDWSDKVTVKTSRGEVKKINVFDKPYSQVCHYQKECDFKCFNPPNKYDLADKDLDYSTYRFDSMNYEINELITQIKKLFSKSDILLTLDQILSKLPAKYSKDRKLVYKTLDEMIKHKSEVVDKFNRQGYLIYRGNYYIYQPININNEDLLIYQRIVPPPVKINKIDILEFDNIYKI